MTARYGFCGRFIDLRSRTRDQMVQAARSGKQNILEASQASGGSKEAEIKLTNVARASIEELLEDCAISSAPATTFSGPKTPKKPSSSAGLAPSQIDRMSPTGPILKPAHPRSWPISSSASFTKPTTCSTSSSAVWSAISSRKAACANACCAPASKLAPGANHNRSYRSYPSYQGGPNPAKSAA